jgi:hypothetical protein
MSDVTSKIEGALSIPSKIVQDVVQDVVQDAIEVEVEVDTSQLQKKAEYNGRKDDIKDDYEISRATLRSTIEKGMSALDRILTIGEETEHPRVFEVATQMMRAINDASKDLLEVQKRIKEVESEREVAGPTSVTNALFIGSNAELMQLLKGKKDHKKLDG